ncbi:MAG: MAPEG family protein [Bdellovibrionales bacterium]
MNIHALFNNAGMLEDRYTAAVILVDMIIYFALVFNVGRARIKFKVQAPSTDGPPEFRRVYRTQMNTMEQLMLHLPLLWLAAVSIGDSYAALLGCLWIVGRVLYARDYYKAAKGRQRGFFIALFSNVVLLISVAAGIVAAF